ncbi:MAG: hypothetical protein IKW90_02160 [Lachnospiraceae bacterium]|nr:hypothetical protein [Lachnospiraceae bacterium]
MDPDKMMFVLTSDDKMYGAKQLLNTERMDDIAGQLGGDFVVLPSSVHESIILPNAAGIDRGELEGIVQSVNSTVLEAQDFLSDNVYCYDAQEHELLRADHYQDRQAEKSRMAAVSEKEAAYGLGDVKEAKAEKPREKVSVKEQIAEKKAIISHNTAEKASPVRNHNKEL